MAGITTPTWLKVLYENRFEIDPRESARFLSTSLLSGVNTCGASIEHLLYSKAIQATQIHAPVFILGVFRSGTTYLHQLMTMDQRFAYPNLFQVLFPNQFLSFESMTSKWAQFALPKNRPQDNVPVAFSLAAEEEWAMCGLIGRSMMMDIVFPKNATLYDRYIDMDQLTEQERHQWSQALLWFLKKVTYKYHKPLILKSPAHTARVKILLSLFPDAKFIHIRRNPYDVFRSWCHMTRQIKPCRQFNRRDGSIEDDVIDFYRQIYDLYLRDKHLIPADRLVEVAYEDLVADPLPILNHIYDAINLPDFSVVKEQFNAHFDTKKPYKNNKFKPLNPQHLARINTEWKHFFELWNYPIITP